MRYFLYRGQHGVIGPWGPLEPGDVVVVADDEADGLAGVPETPADERRQTPVLPARPGRADFLEVEPTDEALIAIAAGDRPDPETLRPRAEPGTFHTEEDGDAAADQDAVDAEDGEPVSLGSAEAEPFGADAGGGDDAGPLTRNAPPPADDPDLPDDEDRTF